MTDAAAPRPPRPIPHQDAHVVDGQLLDSTGVGPLAWRTPGPVTLADREGVFAHSFKCCDCDLEFVLFSWRAHRHGVGTVACPECRRATPMLHWAAQLSTATAFTTDGQQPEIYHYVPVGHAVLLDDSSEPPASRYPASGGAVDAAPDAVTDAGGAA